MFEFVLTVLVFEFIGWAVGLGVSIVAAALKICMWSIRTVTWCCGGVVRVLRDLPRDSSMPRKEEDDYGTND